MQQKISNKRIAKNLIMSLVAQAISIITSLVLNLLVPKFIDTLQYSYWQTYTLYAGYTGIFHFGLLDGLVLRYSRYNYDEIDKPRVRSQFQLLLGVNALLSIIGCTFSLFVTNSITREILILFLVAVTVKNVFGYTSYSFQITNRIPKYAMIIIVQRAAYAVFVIVLLLCKVNDFYWYCIADIFGDAFGSALGAIFNRGMYFGRGIPFKECFKEARFNVSAGLMLLVANFSSNFIVGGAKMIIQWRWDELLFGQVSFSFSVSNLFLTFITAISVVLFPSLKRMDNSDLPDIYTKIRNAISPLLFFAMICYFPGCWILEMWLPDYSDSLIYLGMLLPLVVFSAKVNLLTNNYLKAYRKEKLMLAINVCAVVVGVALFVVGAYVLNNLMFVLYSLVAVIMLYSVASEIAVMKLIGKNIVKDFIIEFIMTALFIIAVGFLERWWACLAYAVALAVYAVIYRKSIAALFRTAINLLKRGKPKTDTAGDGD